MPATVRSRGQRVWGVAMPDLPLTGTRVLDLTRLLPGGHATQILADLGADVLKVEEPGPGDYARAMPPMTHGVGQAFLAVNRNKRSVSLNLKHPHGREALLRLADQADVLVESYRPGVMARLGLAHATLLERNLRLVVCAITGYGQEGPYSQRPGHDLNYIGYAGLLAHLARRGEPPVMPGAQFADIGGGGLMAVVGILGALVGRATSGKGRIVDVSMLDGALGLLPLLGSNVLNGVAEPAPETFYLAGALPGYNIYEAADGRYVTLGALEPKFWAEFCRRIERPDLIDRQIPIDAEDRRATMDELAATFRTKTRDEWVALLGDADVCLGPVNTLEEALADPQVRSRGMVFAADYGDGEAAGRGLRTSPLISDAPVAMRRGLPRLGEHTREALTAVGYSADEIAALVAEGAAAEG